MARNNTLKNGELTDIAFYILLSLVEANHGYSIIKKVDEITGGDIKIGAGSLYSTLKKLVNEEIIEQVLEDSFNKKTYIITQKGLNLLNQDYSRRKLMIRHADQVLGEEVN